MGNGPRRCRTTETAAPRGGASVGPHEQGCGPVACADRTARRGGRNADRTPRGDGHRATHGNMRCELGTSTDPCSPVAAGAGEQGGQPALAHGLGRAKQASHVQAWLARWPDGKSGGPVRSGGPRRARHGGSSGRRAKRWREKVGQRVHGQQLRSARPARGAAGRSVRSALSGSPRAEQREAPHGVKGCPAADRNLSSARQPAVWLQTEICLAPDSKSACFS